MRNGLFKEHKRLMDNIFNSFSDSFFFLHTTQTLVIDVFFGEAVLARCLPEGFNCTSADTKCCKQSSLNIFKLSIVEQAL